LIKRLPFASGAVTDAVLQPDGKIVVVGWTGVDIDFYVTRLNANGTVDPTFAPAKERLSELEDGAAREKALAARGKRATMAANTPSAPVVIAALPGNQITSVRADAEPAQWRPSPAVATEPVPPPLQASFTLRPTLEDREGAAAAPGRAHRLPAPALAPAQPATPTPPAAVEHVVVPAQAVTTTKRTPGFEIITMAEPEAPPSKPPPVPTAPAVSGQGFGVQLGSFKTEALAQHGWDTVRNKSGDLLNNLKPAIESVTVGGKGLMYRLFADSFADRSGAASLCQALKARGASCFVVER